MQSILICPSERPAVAALAESCPLALLSVLGKPLVFYWLELLVSKGCRHVRLAVALHHAEQMREMVGSGERWGLEIQIIPTTRELSPEIAPLVLGGNGGQPWLPKPWDVVVADELPGVPAHKLFESYATWHEAHRLLLPRALTADRIGVTEISKNVWAGRRTKIARTADIVGPCWLGENVVVGPRTVIGPETILDDQVYVEGGAKVVRSIVSVGTLVGKNAFLLNALANAEKLINWNTGAITPLNSHYPLAALTPPPKLQRRRFWSGLFDRFNTRPRPLPTQPTVIVENHQPVSQPLPTLPTTNPAMVAPPEFQTQITGESVRSKQLTQTVNQ